MGAYTIFGLEVEFFSRIPLRRSQAAIPAKQA